VTPEARDQGQIRSKARGAVRASKSWGGYGWFMTFGTFLPLPLLLLGYLVNITLVGAPLARRIYRFALFIPTMGQEPPGADRMKAKMEASGKKPLGERIRPYSPPGWIERRGKPVSMPARIVWFVLVGWWFGGIWVVTAWSVLLLPYPLLQIIWSLLDDLPSIMTLAWPQPRPNPRGSAAPAGVAPATE
jgi:uncharacterized membrane protein YccF (DUF307 family)